MLKTLVNHQGTWNPTKIPNTTRQRKLRLLKAADALRKREFRADNGREGRSAESRWSMSKKPRVEEIRDAGVFRRQPRSPAPLRLWQLPDPRPRIWSQRPSRRPSVGPSRKALRDTDTVWNRYATGRRSMSRAMCLHCCSKWLGFESKSYSVNQPHDRRDSSNSPPASAGLATLQLPAATRSSRCVTAAGSCSSHFESIRYDTWSMHALSTGLPEKDQRFH